MRGAANGDCSTLGQVDARAAQLALRAGRHRLGPGLSFPGFQSAPARSAAAVDTPLMERGPAIVLGPAE